MKRSKFSLSHYHLMSTKMGYLAPCGITEVLPGDTFQHATSILIRLSPLVAPVMHPVHIRLHHWFVPHRLVWDKWEDFITGGPDGLDASVFPTVTLNETNAPNYSLADYFGMPPIAVGGGTYTTSALPFRAYALIFNEWYRDQDLVAALALSKASGADVTTSLALQNAAWEKDYFTTARPFAQKGPFVSIPITGIATDNAGFINANTGPVRETGRTTTTSYQPYYQTVAPGNIVVRGTPASAGVNAYPDIVARIDDLRKALALQRYEEARARYGSRYVEYLRYLGIRSSDARLQKPEYLGGGKQTIQFSEVLQSSPSAAPATPTGALKGHGIAGLRTNRYRRFFEEHGYVISLLSVKPKTMYTESLQRSFRRRVKEDFFTRELQHIGQQQIFNGEVATTNAAGVVDPNRDNVFGYQDRYDEYRRQASIVTGEFRKSTLNFWHMGRSFAVAPTLNASFVVSNPTNRIFADQTGTDTLYMMINHSLQARRMVSNNATPRTF